MDALGYGNLIVTEFCYPWRSNHLFLQLVMTELKSHVYSKFLDASGLTCPLPLLKAKLALAQLESGEVLKVTATDGASQRDFHSFAKLTGHELLHEVQAEGAWHYWLRKG